MKTNAKQRATLLRRCNCTIEIDSEGNATHEEGCAIRRLITDVDDAVKLLDAARDANTQAYHNPPCEECLGCRIRTFLKEPDA